MPWSQIANLTGPPGADGDDADVTAHEAAGDPHPQYLTSAEGNAAYVAANDSRLTNARTPTAHKASHATGGTDALSPADIGALATTARGAASGVASLDSGTKVPIAQIPTGQTSTTVPLGNDSRFTDARTPTAHTHAAADVNSGTLDIARIPTGQTGTTVPLGNDARFSDARTPTAHVHSGADITSGTVPYGRLPVGSAASTVAAGDDSRFTNARTPTAHAASHAAGQSDALTPLAIGARRDLVPTAVKTGAYTAAPGELVMVNATSGPITITLPSLAVGSLVGVKKIDASANVVTIASAAGQTIGAQAAATTTISSQYQIAELQYNSSTNWAIVGGQLALTTLDLRYLLASSKAAASGVASLDSATKLPVAQMPVVLSAVRTITYGATITPDAAGAGNLLECTATGNLIVAAPTNPVNGQQLRIGVLASGASRTVTFDSAIRVSTGLTAGPYTVAQDQVLLCVLTYSTLRTTDAWILTACTVSA